jgi:hypothetical protein
MCWRKSRERSRVPHRWSNGGGLAAGPSAWIRSGRSSNTGTERAPETREMITLVRGGSVQGWGRLIAAVEEALRLGVSDAAAVLHIFNMPDPEQRRQYAMSLAEELAQFERPMPVMDEYDLLLSGTAGTGLGTAWYPG